MWSVRVVAMGLLALMLMTLWRVLRALGAEPMQLLALMGFGMLAGVPSTLLLLWVARHAPAPDPYESPGVTDWRTAEQRRADERAELEAEYGNAGKWIPINGRTCYVVPQVDAFSGDGEEIGVGYGDDWEYWYGDYRSDKQFTIAGVITDGGGIARRSLISGWSYYL